jgi:hypothetical protein
MERNSKRSKKGLIELHVRELGQLFHLLDPAPFYDRKLDRDAEQYIVDHARDHSRAASLSIVIYVDERISAEECRKVADAVRAHFTRNIERSRRDMRQLFARGRVALAIGLPILFASIIAGESVQLSGAGPLAGVLRESLLVGGWVAMWRPLEVFLYDWWPIRERRRIFERLGSMDVQVVPSQETS